MDNYPNLTDHEKSADARELRRALDEARAEAETWRMLKTPNRKAHHDLLEKTIWMLADARRWAAAWKLAAKSERENARALDFAARSHAAYEMETAEELGRVTAERDALRAAVEAVEYVPIATRVGVDLCAWCGQHRDFGHAADCQRQRALGER